MRVSAKTAQDCYPQNTIKEQNKWTTANTASYVFLQRCTACQRINLVHPGFRQLLFVLPELQRHLRGKGDVGRKPKCDSMIRWLLTRSCAV